MLMDVSLMRLPSCLAAMVLSLHAAAPALADPLAPEGTRPAKAVVELFTSQGCSSCPPADRLMKSYAESKDYVAFTLPVDIWDHLGWKDTLAAPKNTQRQRDYANVFVQGPVYTPETVINGVAHAVGSNRSKIEDAIDNDAKAFEARRVPVSFAHNDNIFVINLGAAPEGRQANPATVWLGVVNRSVTVPIKRGENGGASVTYYNVLRDLVPIGAWDGKQKQLQLTGAAVLNSEAQSTFVLVQEENSGPIIGAAWVGR